MTAIKLVDSMHWLPHVIISGATKILRVNRCKCRLWGPGIPGPFPLAWSIPSVPWSQGLKILGSPMRSSDFVSGNLNATVATLERLTHLACAQSSISHVLHAFICFVSYTSNMAKYWRQAAAAWRFFSFESFLSSYAYSGGGAQKKNVEHQKKGRSVVLEQGAVATKAMTTCLVGSLAMLHI